MTEKNDRLLTDGEALKAMNKYPIHATQAVRISDLELDCYTRLLLTQDAKTARMVAEECLGLSDLILQFAEHGDYANGVEFSGADEGRIRAGEALDEYRDELIALKSRYLKEQHE